MTNLNCTVTSCAYNDRHLCNRHGIRIEAGMAKGESSTCCVSYQSQNTMPEITTMTNLNVSQEKPELSTEVSCAAQSCVFNSGGSCAAEEITVVGQKHTSHCTQTSCKSYRDV